MSCKTTVIIDGFSTQRYQNTFYYSKFKSPIIDKKRIVPINKTHVSYERYLAPYYKLEPILCKVIINIQ